MRQNHVTRRDFIKITGGGMAAIAVGSWLPDIFRGSAQAAVLPTVNLSMEEALVEMVDTDKVFHWVFKLDQATLPSLPGPVIFATTGDQVTINVKNNLDEPHEFKIVAAGPGGADIVSDPAVIYPGATGVVTFTPGVAGTFMYLDPRNAPVNRVLGLHGAFIVLPATGNTPYTSPTAKVQQLFNDFGTTPQFPGEPWIAVRPANVAANDMLVEAAGPALEPFLYRTRIWLFCQVEPRFNEIAAAGGNAEPGGGITAANFAASFLPRYFLLNGQSGVFASHNHATVLEGFIGEPHLVRCLNAGLAAESLHLHANHYYVTAVNDNVQGTVTNLDAMTLGSLESDAVTPAGSFDLSARLFLKGGSRVDWAVPFIRPPDIPGPDIPLRDLIPEELALVLGNVYQSPLRYPMHDHMEQSQTAAGGNYPEGSVTDIIFLGDLDKVPFPETGIPKNKGRGLGRGRFKG